MATFVPTVAVAILAVAIGYGGVWNANILAAAAARGPLRDDLLRRTDLWLYDAIGLGTSYDGLFPIVRAAPIFSLLEAGYLMVFPELLTVLIYLTLREPERLSRAVAVLFATYGAALLVFLIFPTAGPASSIRSRSHRRSAPRRRARSWR